MVLYLYFLRNFFKQLLYIIIFNIFSLFTYYFNNKLKSFLLFTQNTFEKINITKMEINFENCANYCGWVKKKASKVMVGWQKRFFRIIGGKVILYSEKENDNNPKGQIMISAINQAVAIDKNQFQLALGNKCFHLKTKEPEKRDEWVKVINFLVEYNAKKQKEAPKLEDEALGDNIKGKSNKINTLDKGTLDLIRNAGFGASEDMMLNDKLIKAKGIDKLINISKQEIKSRIYSGFLYKHHKTHDYFQKRWFFLISSRPLKDKLYEKDEMSLDENKYKKEWIKFDQLFYFKYENEKEPSGPIDGLDLSLSHKIECSDKEGKYYLILDVEDRVFEFYSEIKGDRDLWFEALKNSRRTAKEIKNSIKKHPRNIQRLESILEEGQNKLLEELEKEKMKTIGDYKEM